MVTGLASHGKDEDKDNEELSEELKKSRATIDKLKKVIADQQKILDIHFALPAKRDELDALKEELETHIDELNLQAEQLLKTQAELRDSEKKFKAIFDNAGPGIVISNSNGHIEDCNAAFREMLGYGEGELRGKHFSDLTYPDDIGKNLALFRRMIEGEADKYWMDKRYVRKEGRAMWCHLTVSAIREHGAFQYCLAVVEDIDERRRMEDAVKWSERYLASIFDGIQEGISILDPESGRLKIVAHRGFERPFLDYFENVAEGHAACGTAMMQMDRVVVEDVSRSPVFVGTPDLEVMLAAGARAFPTR
jgi:PAS domain S-box-containing protein